jgi:uncharacterized membrane protein
LKRRVSWKKFSILVAMSIFGLWASSMVLVIFYELHQAPPFCTLPQQTSGISINCEAVLSSPYSSIFGIPLEVLAVGYFIVALGLIYLVSFGPENVFRKSFKTLFVWRFAGLFMVPYLLVVELLILRAICLYCTMMHIAIVTDFGIISYLLFYKKGIGSYGPGTGAGTQASAGVAGQEPISAP